MRAFVACLCLTVGRRSKPRESRPVCSAYPNGRSARSSCRIILHLVCTRVLLLRNSPTLQHASRHLSLRGRGTPTSRTTPRTYIMWHKHTHTHTRPDRMWAVSNNSAFPSIEFELTSNSPRPILLAVSASWLPSNSDSHQLLCVSVSQSDSHFDSQSHLVLRLLLDGVCLLSKLTLAWHSAPGISPTKCKAATANRTLFFDLDLDVDKCTHQNSCMRPKVTTAVSCKMMLINERFYCNIASVTEIESC